MTIAKEDDDFSPLESLEIHIVNNGFLVTTRTADQDEEEFVFDSHQKTLRFIKNEIFPDKA